MDQTRAEKPVPVATVFRVQDSGTCQDCGTGGVTVIEADIGQSEWMLICTDCLIERLREMQEKLGTDGRYHRFGAGPEGGSPPVA